METSPDTEMSPFWPLTINTMLKHMCNNAYTSQIFGLQLRTGKYLKLIVPYLHIFFIRIWTDRYKKLLTLAPKNVILGGFLLGVTCCHGEVVQISEHCRQGPSVKSHAHYTMDSNCDWGTSELLRNHRMKSRISFLHRSLGERNAYWQPYCVLSYEGISSTMVYNEM